MKIFDMLYLAKKITIISLMLSLFSCVSSVTTDQSYDQKIEESTAKNKEQNPAKSLSINKSNNKNSNSSNSIKNNAIKDIVKPPVTAISKAINNTNNTKLDSGNKQQLKQDKIETKKENINNLSLVSDVLSPATTLAGTNRLDDIPLPLVGDVANSAKIIVQGKKVLEQGKLIEVLKEEIDKIKKHKINSNDAKIINQKENKIKELKEQIKNTLNDIKLAALVETSQFPADVLSVVVEHLKKSPAQKYIIDILPVLQSASIPLQIIKIKKTVNEIKNIAQEKNKIAEDIKTLTKNKGNKLLIEILDLKLDYLSKLKLANKSAELIGNVMDLMQSGGSTTAASLKAAALKTSAALVGKILWPLVAASIGISATLFIETNKAKIANFINKLPKNYKISKYNREIKSHQEEISKAPKNIVKEILISQKKSTKESLKKLEKANDNYSKKLKAEEKLKQEIYLENNINKIITMQEKLKQISKQVEEANIALERARKEHRQLIESLISTDVENKIDKFQKDKYQKLFSKKEKIKKLKEEMLQMDIIAQKQWRADQIGAAIEDMEEAEDALNYDLRNKKTKAAIFDYLKDNNVANLDDFDKNPGKFLLDYIAH
jgi:hypothetical protein